MKIFGIQIGSSDENEEVPVLKDEYYEVDVPGVEESNTVSHIAVCEHCAAVYHGVHTCKSLLSWLIR